MAIEDHEKFGEWSVALNRLNKAWDDYAVAKGFGYDAELQSREAAVYEALRHFRRISDEIDA